MSEREIERYKERDNQCVCVDQGVSQGVLGGIISLAGCCMTDVSIRENMEEEREREREKEEERNKKKERK